MDSSIDESRLVNEELCSGNGQFAIHKLIPLLGMIIVQETWKQDADAQIVSYRC